ncbi:GrpB family protein [Microlunatus sp. GCM10028923]|uniref:GrpB family protein n=1 Tax=Microlunatus sp. GCM10028923 TaxID=3273400 RepID=UPI00362034C3
MSAETVISAGLAGRIRHSLGLGRGVVEIVPYDPRWPVIFHELVAELLPHLPAAVVAVEHVGSTAVPGLPAKAILDVVIGARHDADAPLVTAALERFGFLPRAESGEPELHRNFGLELDERVRLVNAHLVRYGGSHWSAYLSFRDRLRADDAARDRYARLKDDLAARFGDDRQGYVDGKTAFVHSLS